MGMDSLLLTLGRSAAIPGRKVRKQVELVAALTCCRFLSKHTQVAP